MQLKNANLRLFHDFRKFKGEMIKFYLREFATKFDKIINRFTASHIYISEIKNQKNALTKRTYNYDFRCIFSLYKNDEKLMMLFRYSQESQGKVRKKSHSYLIIK